MISLCPRAFPSVNRSVDPNKNPRPRLLPALLQFDQYLSCDFL